MIFDNGRKNSIRDELKYLSSMTLLVFKELIQIKSTIKRYGNEHSVKLRKLGVMSNLLDKVETNTKWTTSPVTNNDCTDTKQVIHENEQAN